MSTQRYVVYAYSPSLNQQVRQLNLAHLMDTPSKEQATQDAHYFAELQRTNKYLHATDWQPRVQFEEHGIDTLPGWIHGQTRQV
jgi:hypothetical protein